jgi:hydroxymethylbilane synthase
MALKLRIGSRPSRLAITQAEFVRARLSALIPGLNTELISIRTSGDRIKTPSLAGAGGKGLFIKELEQALSSRRVDIAVHSMKDLPAVLSPAYRIAAVPEREDPRDALVTRDAAGLRSMPPGARLGTSSPRRRFEALRLNPKLEVVALRGNVETRLQRVLGGELDATILAMAGLKRLGRLDGLPYEELDEREFVPAAAQAALAIEALAGEPAGGSEEIERALCALNDLKSACETAAERAFLAVIGASCVTPLGVKATLSAGTLELRAILFSPDGAREMADEIRAPAASADAACAVATGTKLGERMLGRGARDLLDHG